jgi:hypothetical protein
LVREGFRGHQLKVGDLVKHNGKRSGEHLGLIVDFDEEGDPVVEFYVQEMESGAYFAAEIEVISESR